MYYLKKWKQAVQVVVVVALFSVGVEHAAGGMASNPSSYIVFDAIYKVEYRPNGFVLIQGKARFPKNSAILNGEATILQINSNQASSPYSPDWTFYNAVVEPCAKLAMIAQASTTKKLQVNVDELQPSPSSDSADGKFFSIEHSAKLKNALWGCALCLTSSSNTSCPQ